MKILFILFALVLVIPNAYSAKTKIDSEGPVSLVYKAKISKKRKKSVSRNKAKEIKAQREAFAAAINGCQINIRNIIDDRQNKDTLGATFAKPLLIKDFDVWLNDIDTKLVDVKFGSYHSDDAAIVITPKITRLYAYAENMNIHGVSAMDIEVMKNGQVTDTHHYRGHASKANMVGAVGEYHKVANRAMEDLIDVLYQDLPSLCGTTLSAN